MYVTDSRSGLDYELCRYGGSRLSFRGPKPPPDGPYLACLGGSDTFGRFIPDPWPGQLGRALGLPVANFGQVNAGIDLVLRDPVILGAAAEARCAVVQVVGAQNMSNRFYTVHPRRNDRFITASPALAALYPEVDFSQIAFTRALLQTLFSASEERFADVVAELQTAWLARMRTVLDALPERTWLLWIGERPVPEAWSGDFGMKAEPLFVTRAMLDALDAQVCGLTEIVDPPARRAVAGMVFREFEAPVAATCLGVRAHDRAAEALAAELGAVLSE